MTPAQALRADEALRNIETAASNLRPAIIHGHMDVVTQSLTEIIANARTLGDTMGLPVMESVAMDMASTRYA